MSGWGTPPGGWNRSAWGARASGPDWDRTRIYRDRERGWIAGVCAGIAEHIGTEPALVRLVAVLGLVFFFVPAVVAYLAFALVLKPRPPTLFASADEESFFRGLRNDPGGALGSIRARFAGLERRLARAERLVTSEEFDLRRRFRDLDR